MNNDIKPFEINSEYATTQDHVAHKLEVVELDTKQFNLVGSHIDVGQAMPSIELCSYDMKSFLTKDQLNKKTIYITMPSLDTPVCNSQFFAFLQAIDTEDLDGVDFVFVTSDTPFALQRFQKEANTHHYLLSDAGNHLFGFELGFQISELNVLTRAIIATNEKNEIVHIQRVPKLTLIPCLHSAYKSLF